ncbi:MAG: hypothetical protein AAB432_02940 [Patescibacteria group bacterium]
MSNRVHITKSNISGSEIKKKLEELTEDSRVHGFELIFTDKGNEVKFEVSFGHGRRERSFKENILAAITAIARHIKKCRLSTYWRV